MARAVTGSYLQRMLDGISMSERARRAIERLGDEIRNQARATYMRRTGQRGPYHEDPLVESIADRHVSEDPSIRLEIGTEQWGQRLTTMYGVAQLVSDSQKMHAQLNEIIELLRTTNQILSRLVTQDTRS